MIIDFHAHAFPERIRAMAMDVLVEKWGKAAPASDGSVAALCHRAKAAGVDCSVILTIATNARQQKNVNDFAIAVNGEPGIVAFGSVHPFSPDAPAELDRIHAAGLKGIKLHPDYQGFFADDPAAIRIYEKAASLGLITVFHAGVDIGMFEPIHCPPKTLAKILPVFGGAPVVAAHFGGFEQWYEVEAHLIGKDLYFDTSYSAGRLCPLHAKRIMENHSPDKLLFGSDTPWSAVAAELCFVKAFAREEDWPAILGGNAQKLLRLPD